MITLTLIAVTNSIENLPINAWNRVAVALKLRLQAKHVWRLTSSQITKACFVELRINVGMRRNAALHYHGA